MVAVIGTVEEYPKKIRNMMEGNRGQIRQRGKRNTFSRDRLKKEIHIVLFKFYCKIQEAMPKGHAPRVNTFIIHNYNR